MRWSSPRRPGDVFEAEKDDEVTRWLELGYVSEVKARCSVKKTVRRKKPMAFRKVIGGILRSPDGVARRWLAHSDEPYIQSARGAVTKTPSLRWNLLIDAVVTACAQFLDEIPFRENPAAFSVEAMEAGEPLRAVDAQIAAGQLLEALPPEPPLVG